mmetsp:Transcript_56390/g.175319  ORF Transcript_56390/g.175319 Transcript_56390/m.175319 type:complete len:224 (-) Transcript_56390:1274-1945(-)
MGRTRWRNIAKMPKQLRPRLKQWKFQSQQHGAFQIQVRRRRSGMIGLPWSSTATRRTLPMCRARPVRLTQTPQTTRMRRACPARRTRTRQTIPRNQTGRRSCTAPSSPQVRRFKSGSWTNRAAPRPRGRSRSRRSSVWMSRAAPKPRGRSRRRRPSAWTRRIALRPPGWSRPSRCQRRSARRPFRASRSRLCCRWTWGRSQPRRPSPPARSGGPPQPKRPARS